VNWKKITSKRIIKRIAATGFWFFFLKGILWLCLPALMALTAWLR